MASMKAGMSIAMVIFVVLTMALFPTVLCLCRCAGCNETFEEVEFNTSIPGETTTNYLWNLTNPLCPGLWNGTHYANECDCCTDTTKELWGNVTGWGESGEGSYCTNWHFVGDVYEKCSLPATINITGLTNATNYAFNTTYCGLNITCELWNFIQLTPLFYIIGVFSTVAIAVVYTTKSKS